MSSIKRVQIQYIVFISAIGYIMNVLGQGQDTVSTSINGATAGLVVFFALKLWTKCFLAMYVVTQFLRTHAYSATSIIWTSIEGLRASVAKPTKPRRTIMRLNACKMLFDTKQIIRNWTFYIFAWRVYNEIFCILGSYAKLLIFSCELGNTGSAPSIIPTP